MGCDQAHPGALLRPLAFPLVPFSSSLPFLIYSCAVLPSPDARTVGRIMATPMFQRFPWLGCLFVAAALSLGAAAPAHADTPRSTSVRPVFADSSLRTLFSGASARDRIIQVCILCMALALFILMKKLVPETYRRGPTERTSVPPSPRAVSSNNCDRSR